MSSPYLFAVTAVPGGYLATWTNDASLNHTNVISMSLVYTTTETDAQFKTIVLEPKVVKDLVISEYLLTGLLTGFTYQMSLQIASTMDGLSGVSDIIEFAVESVPSKPLFNVIAGDSQIDFSLLNASKKVISLDDLTTRFDGFESITMIKVSLSDKTAKLGKNITFTADASNNFYRDGGFSLNAINNFSNLQSDHTYAVALTYFNEQGSSEISDTLFFTPSKLPVVMDVAAVEYIYFNKTSTGGAIILWNPPKNGLSGFRSVANVRNYSVWRALVDASGIAGVETNLITLAIDASGNNSAIQSRDASDNLIPTMFDAVSYKFKYNDTTSTNGTKYRYFITATNQYGQSTLKDISSCADVIVGGIPLAPGVTSTPVDRQLKLSVNTTGKFNGLPSTGKVLVKLYAYSQKDLIDASQNALHGYNWAEMTLDASSCVTLTGLNNGTLYDASVKIQTQSAVVASSKYLSPAGALSNSTSPYKAPSFPTGLRASPVDASGNPLDAKLNLSWDAKTYLVANGFGIDASVNFVIMKHEGLDASGNKINASELTNTSTANTHQDTGLTNDKVYHYSLKAKVHNTELNMPVASAESTPVVAGFSFASPAAVTNLVADCSGNGDLFVTWTNIADASANYKLVLTKNNTLADIIVTLDPTASGVILPDRLYNFTMGTQYSIAVSSVITRNGNKYDSAAVTTTGIPFLTPGAVQDLQLSVQDSNIYAVWEKPLTMDASGIVTGVTINSYDVILQDAFGIPISTTPINTSVLYHTIPATNGIRYIVKVVAKGLAGAKVVYGVASSSESVVVNAGPVVPIAGHSEASDKTIKLIWVHTDSQVNTFKIFQNNVLLNNPNPKIVSEGVYNTGNIIGNIWSTTIKGLTNGKEYTFEVIASKLSVDSLPVSITATPYTATSAPMPADLPFAVSANSLTLNWKVPEYKDDMTLFYKVSLFDTSNNTLSDASGVLVNSYPVNDISQLTHNASNLDNGRSYFAKVSAYSKIGSSFSYPTSVPLRIPAYGSMKVNVAPPNVTNLVAAPKDKSVVLTWTDPSGVLNYPYTTTIVQRLNDSSVYEQIGSDSHGTFTDRNLINGKKYEYKVIAQHGNNNAQQANGVTSEVKPAGAPIFTFNNVATINNIDFMLQYNRNGAAVTSATLVGIDFSGIAHVVASAVLESQTAAHSEVFNGESCLKTETYNWQIPHIAGNTKIHDLLFIMTNSAGSTVVSWPRSPNAFDK